MCLLWRPSKLDRKGVIHGHTSTLYGLPFCLKGLLSACSASYFTEAAGDGWFTGIFNFHWSFLHNTFVSCRVNTQENKALLWAEIPAPYESWQGVTATCHTEVMLRRVYSLLFSRVTMVCKHKGKSRNTTGEKAAKRPQAQAVITSPLRSGSGKGFWGPLWIKKNLEEIVFPFDFHFVFSMLLERTVIKWKQDQKRWKEGRKVIQRK